MGGVPPPPGAGGSRSKSRGTRSVSHPSQGSASLTTLSFVHCRPRGVARAAGGLGRPQRGDPRRGSPLYPLLRCISTGEFRALRRAARAPPLDPARFFVKKRGKKLLLGQTFASPSPSPLGRVIKSVREADTLAAEWHLPREWERRVGPETSRGRHHPISVFLWGSTPFLWARPKKWGGTGSTRQNQPTAKRRVPQTCRAFSRFDLPRGQRTRGTSRTPSPTGLKRQCAEAAGGLSRPQRGDPRRGSPL